MSMFFFKKKQEQKPYKIFFELIQNYFDTRSIPIEIDYENGVVTILEGGLKINLERLVKLCTNEPQNAWSSIIIQFLETCIQGIDESRELLKKAKDFSEIKDLLLVRIWPEKNIDDTFIWRSSGISGLATKLVIDFPTSIVNVLTDDARAWNIPQDDLFSCALKNLIERKKPTIKETTLNSGAKFVIITSEDFFAGEHILHVEDFPSCIGEYGSLLSLPHRDLILSYPINKNFPEIMEITEQFVFLTLRQYTSHEAPLSSSLYWYAHEKRFIEIPIKMSEGQNTQPQLLIPAEFTKLLNMIAGVDVK